MAENFKGASTVRYGITKSHDRIEGVMQIPCADDEAKLVRLHKPLEVLIVSWEAERTGAPPIVPHPAEFEPNLVFLGGTRSAIVPIPKPEGQGHYWVMGGVYRYALKIVAGLDSAFSTGRVPWESVSPQEHTIPATAFERQLMAQGQQPSKIQ